MVVGYIIIAFAASVGAFAVAMSLGASLWVGLASYILVGAGAVFGLTAVRFVVGLPGAGVDNSARPRPCVSDTETSAPAAAPCMRILAVDDDPFILELLPLIAARSGFNQVRTAESATAALSILSDDPGFDCLLVDINMPEMNGIELCRQVRAIGAYQTTPIVMLTAMRDLKNMGDAYRAGATDYATKPFDIEELQERLRLAQKGMVAPGSPQVQTRLVSDVMRNPRLGKSVNLVEQWVLVNYLTRVTRKEAAKLDVFTVYSGACDQISDEQPLPDLSEFFVDLANATSVWFSTKKTMMSFSADGHLLIVTQTADHPDHATMENAIEQDIARRTPVFAPGGAGRLGISVGGPVRPEEQRAQRAGRAITNATALAQLRASEKAGRGPLKRISI